MNAWLITWIILRSHESTSDEIAAILSSRKSEKYIAEFVELLYIRATCSATSMARYANSKKGRPFHLQKYGDRIVCGSNRSWLYARKVSKLKIRVDEKAARETIRWIEPPEYKWNETKREIELVKEAEIKQIERSCFTPLSRDVWQR